uniref:Uncharacterized protein n=1 Tax=Panagrolaimus superbus TaxID=310955 RepID=A0A914ZEA8_9BILA
MLERMTSKIEDLRKNLLNEISEIFGEEEENVFESFEEGQFELKTDKELFDEDEEIFGEEFDKVAEEKVLNSETEKELTVGEEKVVKSESKLKTEEEKED